MAQYIEFTPEQKERAATVDLEEFLLRQGEKFIKSGREKRLASDHSITVRGCEWFDHASNEGGRAVSFIQKYYSKSYVEAMSMLLGESIEPVYPQAKKQKPVDQKPFAPPVPNANMHRVFAYLLKTRGLDADVVSYFARRKLLYEDAAHHNAVFIGTDEDSCPRHAHLRSTNSFGKAFRLNVESSDPRYSFHHTGTDGSLYVFEAPIDNLMNDSSLVFKLFAPNKTVLFLGDLGPEAGDILFRESKHLLKSDLVQMAHHGHMNVGMEVYAEILPEGCLWCAPDWLYEEEEFPDYLRDTEGLRRVGRNRLYGTKLTRKWMDLLGVKKHYVTKDGTQRIVL